MSKFLSPSQIAERGIPGIQHKVTVIRKLESQEMHGFQAKKGGRWAVDERCLMAYVEGRPCHHKANVIDLDDVRRTRTA